MLARLFVTILLGVFPISAVAVGVAWFSAWLRIRFHRRRSILQTLSLIVSHNLPLCDGLRAAAHGERNALKRVFGELAARLECGDTLSTALRVAWPTCPARIAGALQGAEAAGTLPSVLRSLAADEADEAPSSAGHGFPILYIGVLCVFFPLAVVFLTVVVAPKYAEILKDFGVPPPAITKFMLMRGWLGATQIGLSVIGVLGFAAMLAVVQGAVGSHFRVRTPDSPSWPALLLDFAAWRLPLLRQVAERRALARQLPLIHMAIRGGNDVPAAARSAAMADANLFARRRLRRWADEIERGRAPAEAARHAGLPTPVIRALAAGGDAAQLSARLEYLAGYYRSLVVHWERVAAALVMPAIIVLWGLCVLFVILAVFEPIITMENAIMDSVR